MADPDYAGAISNIESGGNYGILGPMTKGDQAFGKYQIMGANIGPWTKEILGAPMSPQEFLANPQAQDAVFQGKFGQYVQKFGPEGAAQAWFAGPGGVGKTDRKDVLGTSVGDYGRRFMAGLGVSDQPSSQMTALAPNAPQAPPQNQTLVPPAFNQPQQAPSLPAYAAQPAQQSAPPQMPALNAPAIQQALRRFNMAQAFSKIPTPTGYQGFKLS